MVFEGVVSTIDFQDGGTAAVAEVETKGDGENGPFVRLQSWEEPLHDNSHEWLRSIEGKRVRVTVEVI